MTPRRGEPAPLAIGDLFSLLTAFRLFPSRQPQAIERRDTPSSHVVLRDEQQHTPMALSTASPTNMPKSQPDSTRHDFSKTTTICVGGDGEEKQNIHIHTSFAIQSSKILRFAIEGEGARDQRISLKAEVPEFQMYVAWLYTGKITPWEIDSIQERGGDLLHLYIIGDYLDDAKFRNEVMDVLGGLTNYAASSKPFVLSDFSDNDVNWALEKTAAGAPLRVFLFTKLGAEIVGHRDSITSFKNRFSSDVLLDLLMALMSNYDLKLVINGAFLKRKELFFERCVFHKHEDGDRRCPGSQ